MKIERQAVAGAFVAALVVLAGAIGFVYFTSDPASATGTTTADVLKIDGESLSGQVDEVHLETSGEVEWRDLQADAHHVRVIMQAKDDSDGNGWNTFAVHRYNGVEGRAGSLTFTGVDGALIENTEFTSADFSADADGQIRSTYVDIRVIVQVFDDDGDRVQFVDHHRVKITIENIDDPLAEGSSDLDGRVVMA